ncbi:hypothetical protein Ocin01_19208 [Orchesella cincta]|uniref:Uncharacterized protein n=1 Tax=Orchesella cincta TaxID=48709 RepID=A0A1D2M3C8_ORCCI|nr:hypothetical protein Ocin01_19208 [Orchesella cincta]
MEGKAASTAYSDDGDVVVIEKINYKFQQVYTATWDIREFKKYFHIHLENSSKDGTELCPIQTGEKIGLPCKWIAGLYIYPLEEDANNNDPKADSNFNIRISMRLVDAPRCARSLFQLISSDKGIMVFSPNSLAFVRCNCRKSILWKWNSNGASGTCFSTWRVHFAVPLSNMLQGPLDWGLSAGALDLCVTHADQKLARKEAKLTKEINQTCIMHGITGIAFSDHNDECFMQ